jgi:SAM-dependent methyltransferase
MLTETLDNLIRERRGNRSLKHYRYLYSRYNSRVPLKNKRILDIGCGNGLLLGTNSVLSEPAMAIGIDNYKGEGSPLDEIGFVRKLRQSLNLPCLSFMAADARRMPFKEGRFDVIFASQFLHHIHISQERLSRDKSPESLPVYKVLKRIHSLLSADGVLVVTEAPRYTALRLMQPLGVTRDIDYSTKQEPADWIYMLKHCGFRDISVKYHTPYPLRYLSPLLGTELTRYLVSNQYYIFACK